MANKVLVIGQSGHGKSHSLQFLDPKETFIFHCDEKALPFKGWKKNYKTVWDDDGNPRFQVGNYVEVDNMAKITIYLPRIARTRPEIKNIVIDTITNAMFRSVMREVNNENWKKFLEFAGEVDDLILSVRHLRSDLNVIFMAHEEVNEKAGRSNISQFKIPGGKFTREKLDPESRFTTVLFTGTKRVGDKGLWWFETQNNGYNTCKSPQGMFPSFRIPNNIRYVLDAMIAYDNDEDPPKMPEFDPDIARVDENNF